MNGGDRLEKEYRQLLDALQTAKPGKEMRELHRKVKKYGDRVPFILRYPDFPLWVSAMAMVGSVVVFILQMFGIGQ